MVCFVCTNEQRWSPSGFLSVVITDTLSKVGRSCTISMGANCYRFLPVTQPHPHLLFCTRYDRYPGVRLRHRRRSHLTRTPLARDGFCSQDDRNLRFLTIQYRCLASHHVNRDLVSPQISLRVCKIGHRSKRVRMLLAQHSRPRAHHLDLVKLPYSPIDRCTQTHAARTLLQLDDQLDEALNKSRATKDEHFSRRL
jgi:hypothetical protein